jgi:triosephosphate isomerase
MTRRVVAGNWKMNHGLAATRSFFEALDIQDAVKAGVEVLVFPPALSFATAKASATSDVHLGIQNLYFEESGAFTGQLSVGMVKEAGATHVLVGHSERRQLFHESDAWVAQKTAVVLTAGLTPVVCVGETLDERKAGRVSEVITGQLDAVMSTFAANPDREVLVAYEPVWAIGTGETATPADARSAHATLRERLVAGLGASRGASVPLLYGGSVKPGNAFELMSVEDVDGVLVGGASLDPADFAAIAKAGAETLPSNN